MKLHPRLSRTALELVTRFETFQPQALPAAAGGWTVGFGHTRTTREGVRVSRSDAEALLLYDLSAAADTVADALFAPVTQRQFEALTAFAFNIGADNFRRSSALARINAGSELDAADEIERWRRAELGAGAQVVDALVRRRAAEKAHFLGLPEGFSKSPSAVLRPLASEGGETAPPPPPPELATPSATLHAANSVQARLRELVPDPDPVVPAYVQASEAPPFPDLDIEPTSVPADVEAAFDFGPEIDAAPDLAPAPAPAPANDTMASEAISEATAPISEAPASLTSAPLPPPPPPAPHVQPAAEDAVEVESVAATPSTDAPARSRKARLSARSVFALVTALGACVFVAAAVLILGGKPGFGNLGLGVIGALIMTPGVYGLLGPRPPAG